MLLEILQLFPPFVFGILALFHSFGPTSHRSSKPILAGLLVRVLAKQVLSTVRHIFLLGRSCLIAKHSVALGTVMLRRLVVRSFVGAHYTGPKSCLLLPQDPDGYVAVRYRGRSSIGNLLDLVCRPFSFCI